MKIYRQIKISDEEQDEFVFPHKMAMTGEKLHSKAEIAYELGIRDKRIAELEKRNTEILNRVAEAETRMLAAVLGSTGAIEDCKKSMEAHNLEQEANGCFEAILNINAYSKNGSAFILVRDVNNFGVKKRLQAKALKNPS
jgi:hypothetical protein